MKVFPLLCVLAVCMLAGTVEGQKSKKIALADLPPAVSDAIQKKFKDAKFKDFKLTKADEAKVDGKPGYRVSFTCKSKSITPNIKSDGSVWVTPEGKIKHGYRSI